MSLLDHQVIIYGPPLSTLWAAPRPRATSRYLGWRVGGQDLVAAGERRHDPEHCFAVLAAVKEFPAGVVVPGCLM
ncbi:MAG: hypothetical protein ACREX8_06935 [Gammaproteobacteria bacterium]